MNMNTPILVGSGQYVDRGAPSPISSLAPAAMAAEAARRALLDCAAQGDLAATVDVLAVARLFEHSVREAVMWPNPFGCSNNMPWSVANRLGVTPQRAIYAEVGGETPQRLVNQMAEAIHAGEARSVVLTGAEALATIRQAQRSGVELDWHEEVAGEFEDLWPLDPMNSDYERRHGITLPINVYALFETARRHELGLNPDAYREQIGALFAPFSAVAASNPYAQFPTAREVGEIATYSAQNFPLCEPYAKWMVAQDAVNQGAAVVMTSVGQARELGIPEAQWIFLKAYADVDELPVVERPRLASSAAQGLALKRVLDDAEIGVADLDLIDLYSCFPIAVSSACEHLALPTDGSAALTLTGGLPFFGGPGNNYSLHGIAEVVQRLRGKAQGHALVAANGGYLSKHSVGVYSRSLAGDWVPRSSAAERRTAKTPTSVSVTEVANGAATIESCAAVYARGAASGGFIVGRLDSNDQRFLAVVQADDAQAQELLFSDAPIGRAVAVRHLDGMNTFSAA